MRKLIPLLAVTAMLTGLTLVARAAEQKTIVGDGVCAKCALKETKTCQNVVIVKDGGKEVKYYLAANPVSKKYHGSSGVCQASTDAPVKTKVTGDVEEQNGKNVITATSIEKVD